MAKVLRVHGSKFCERACSDCDGDHHWMEECVQDEDLDEDMHDDVMNLPDVGEPYLACKHCKAWAEYEDWWDDEAEFTTEDVR